MKDPRIKHVCYLNRDRDAQSRQFSPAGADTRPTVSSGRVTFLQVDLCQPFFTLSPDELRTHSIHDYQSHPQTLSQ